ncbi:hypothetical protein JMJ35_003378 [Cladonia borealis]|uniref:NADP-dependent oxidoreductase domain-containing protein n=1 Tax=Cladonia borealis TaxID=184061 RepID=A0AA39R799_9LECA|nr:hypothetical protein JMJ35_003378 [Cladonia borealis]
MPSALFENLVLHGSKQVIPAFLYGTAWKKEKTAELVYQALCSGFRAVDTAAQPKHYREDLVGDGIRRATKEGKVSRDELFIQTKFTSIHGQDPNKMPYDPNLPITDQIHTSIKSSLHNLRSSPDPSSAGSTILDSLVLHTPLPTLAETLEAWRTLETYVPHKIRNLGISNVPMGTLEQLYEAAKVKPAVVQNRFYPNTHFDNKVRAFCVEKGIIYQAFWTLSANPKIVHGAELGAVCHSLGLSSVHEAMYCLTLSLDNVVILNGTKNEEHMRGDLEALTKAKTYAEENPESWKGYVERFRALIEW